MTAMRLGGFVLVVVVASCGGGSGSPGGDAGGSDVAKVDARTDAAKDVAVDAPGTINDWSCLGHVKLAPPAKSTLNLMVSPVDIVSNMALPNVVVDACSATDGTCSKPVATATTNAMGIATLSVPAGTKGFDGFWRYQPSGDLESLEFSNIPFRNDVQVNGRQAWTHADVAIVLGSAGASWDTKKGIVGMQVGDCTSTYLHQDTVTAPTGHTRAIGVSFSIKPSDPGVVQGYFLGDTLSTTAKQTDASGQGGWLNVPEGWVTMTATLVATGQTIATARVYAKAGALTGTSVSPDH